MTSLKKLREHRLAPVLPSVTTIRPKSTVRRYQLLRKHSQGRLSRVSGSVTVAPAYATESTQLSRIGPHGENQTTRSARISLAFCTIFRHWRSGKLLYAADYGYESWCFLVRA